MAQSLESLTPEQLASAVTIQIMQHVGDSLAVKHGKETVFEKIPTPELGMVVKLIGSGEYDLTLRKLKAIGVIKTFDICKMRWLVGIFKILKLIFESTHVRDDQPTDAPAQN